MTNRSKAPSAQMKYIVNLGLFAFTHQASDQAGRHMIAAARAVMQSTAGGITATPEGQFKRDQ
jgi:hypothetical protein